MSQLNRYPGPEPFSLAYRDVFFGRDKDIDSLLSLIEVERLTVLYGESGFGKSSLLEAGVLPILECKLGFQVVPVRFNNYLEDYSWPPAELLRAKLEEESEGENFLASVQSQNLSSWQILKHLQWQSRVQAGVVLVFDQFEELFTYPHGIEELGRVLADLLCNRPPDQFSRLLRLKESQGKLALSDEKLSVLASQPDLHIVMVVRSDRLSLLDRLSRHLPFILRNNFELGALDRHQAELAIRSPAQAEGDFSSPTFTYSDGAISAILSFLTSDGTRPLESFQLQLICQYIEQELVLHGGQNHIEHEMLGDVAEIYENFYEKTLGKITGEEGVHARRFIEEGLILEQEMRRIPLHEGQIQEQYGVGDELLRRLVDTHLIRPQPYEGGGFLYEICHDSLVEPILRANERRKQRETAKQIREKWLERRSSRKRRLLWVGGVWAGWVLLSLLGVIPYVGIIIYIAFSIAAFLSFIYVLHEFLTGKSLLARREERKGRI